MVTKQFLDLLDTWGNGRCYENRWCFYRAFVQNLAGVKGEDIREAIAMCNGECGLKNLLLKQRISDRDVFVARLRYAHDNYQGRRAEEKGIKLSEKKLDSLWNKGRYISPERMAQNYLNFFGVFDKNERFNYKKFDIDRLYREIAERVEELNEESWWDINS